MRALLVFNPNATTTDASVRDVIAAALASEVELDVQATKQRGQAIHIVAGAVHEGVEVVFALGGDGTANEALQALAGTEVLLGVVPGGGANVLARSLGLPGDAVSATSALLDRLRHGQTRTLNLGRAGGRWFAFNAGFGYDAAVVRLVERRPRLKRSLHDFAFVWCAVEEWLRGQRVPVEVSFPGGARASGFAITIVGNTTPYTYLGTRPMTVTPEADAGAGLDLVGIRPVASPTLVGIVLRTFLGGRHLRHRAVDHWHDLDGFTLTAAEPLPLMVDGDFAGEHREVAFESVRNALTVLA